MTRIRLSPCARLLTKPWDMDSLKESLVHGLQRVLPSEDEEEAAREEATPELEALPAPPVEMDEAEMLKALQNDRDGAPDGRL